MSADCSSVDIAELSLSCEKLKNKDWLSKSDPFVVLFIAPRAYGGDEVVLSEVAQFQETNGEAEAVETSGKLRASFAGAQWRYVGETEVVWDALSPIFVGKLRLPWDLCDRLNARFEVFDMDNSDSPLEKQDFLGAVEVPLNEVTNARNVSLALRDKRGRSRGAHGALRVCTDRYLYSPATEARTFTLRVVFGAMSGVPGGTRIFYVLSRGAPLAVGPSANSNEIPGWEYMHRSGALQAPTVRRDWAFQDATLREESLTSGDPQRLLRLELYLHRANGTHLRVGATNTFSLAELRRTGLPGRHRVVADAISGANLRSAEFSVESTFFRNISPSSAAESFSLISFNRADQPTRNASNSSPRSGVAGEAELVFRFSNFFWWPGAKKDHILHKLSSRGTVR